MNSVSYLGRNDLRRGIRNNNPFNLIFTSETWLGKIESSLNTDKGKKFEQFQNVAYGVRAGLRDIVGDIDKGKNTIRKLITEFAPPVENDTETYIKQIAKSVNLSPDETIKSVDSNLLFLLAKAIIKKENGLDSKYIYDSEIKTAIANLGKFKTKNITVNSDSISKVNISFVLGLLLFCYTVLIVTV